MFAVRAAPVLFVAEAAAARGRGVEHERQPGRVAARAPPARRVAHLNRHAARPAERAVRGGRGRDRQGAGDRPHAQPDRALHALIRRADFGLALGHRGDEARRRDRRDRGRRGHPRRLLRHVDRRARALRRRRDQLPRLPRLDRARRIAGRTHLDGAGRRRRRRGIRRRRTIGAARHRGCEAHRHQHDVRMAGGRESVGHDASPHSS
jgi:hypothetical protein